MDGGWIDGRLIPALLLIALGVLPAAAQDPGGLAPPPMTAERPQPAPRPVNGDGPGPATPAPSPAQSHTAGDAEPPPPRPRGAASSGADCTDPATCPERAEDAGGRPPVPDTAAAPGRSQGALIPPGTGADTPPSPPAALPDTLRETDFVHSACLLALTLLGVDHRETAPVTDPENRDCGIARPVEVRSIQPGLALESGALMRCETARQLALWTRETVIPAARRLPGSPRVTSLSSGTTYQCRGVTGGPSDSSVSEHALGNAIDIAGFGLDDGTRLAIAPPEDRGDLGVAFQKAVQAGACLYFTTVLGPGSNAAHDDHLHLDIKSRRGGFRLCQ